MHPCKFAVVVESSLGVLFHLLSGKDFRGGVGEFQARLNTFAMHIGTEFVVGQQQAAFGTGGGGAEIEKPGGCAWR